MHMKALVANLSWMKYQFRPIFFPFCLFWQFSRWARGRNQSLERSFSWMVCRNNEASRSFLVSLLADWLDDWFSLIPHSNEAEEGKAGFIYSRPTKKRLLQNCFSLILNSKKDFFPSLQFPFAKYKDWELSSVKYCFYRC